MFVKLRCSDLYLCGNYGAQQPNSGGQKVKTVEIYFKYQLRNPVTGHHVITAFIPLQYFLIL